MKKYSVMLNKFSALTLVSLLSNGLAFASDAPPNDNGGGKDQKAPGLKAKSATLGDVLKSSSAAPGPGASGVTEVSEKSVYDKLSEKVALVYFGIYRGASINNLGNTYQPDTSGNLDPTSPQSLESYVTAGYKLDKDTIVGVTTHFMYFPTMTPTTATQNGQSGMDVQMLDPALMISRANMIDSNGFKLKGLLYVTAPATSNDYLAHHDESLIIAPTIVASWDIPRTKWTLGLYGYVADYVPNSSTQDSARSYKIYAAPNANYQFAKTVAATMWVDLVQATRSYNTPFIGGLDNPTMDIEPGINWDVNSHLSINPILNIYPGDPTLASTSLQAVIIGKL